MGFEAFTPPPQEEAPVQPIVPEGIKDDSKTLEEWVEKQLSALMMRRMAGEDVDLVKDLPSAPEHLIKEEELRTGTNTEDAAGEYLQLMRDALDHPDPNNFYSVWLESQGPDAKATLKMILENPSKVEEAIKERTEKIDTKMKETEAREELLKSPFERVASKLKEAQGKLVKEGLTEDAKHIDAILKKLEQIDETGFETTIELWEGESTPKGNNGWYPDERTKGVILQALGTAYRRGNAQMEDLDIKYYAGQFHTEGVKLRVRENKILEKEGVFSTARVEFPGTWYKQ